MLCTLYYNFVRHLQISSAFSFEWVSNCAKCEAGDFRRQMRKQCSANQLLGKFCSHGLASYRWVFRQNHCSVVSAITLYCDDGEGGGCVHDLPVVCRFCSYNLTSVLWLNGDWIWESITQPFIEVLILNTWLTRRVCVISEALNFTGYITWHKTLRGDLCGVWHHILI